MKKSSEITSGSRKFDVINIDINTKEKCVTDDFCRYCDFFCVFLKRNFGCMLSVFNRKKKSQKCTMNKGLFHKERQALFEYFFHLS